MLFKVCPHCEGISPMYSLLTTATKNCYICYRCLHPFYLKRKSLNNSKNALKIINKEFDLFKKLDLFYYKIILFLRRIN